MDGESVTGSSRLGGPHLAVKALLLDLDGTLLDTARDLWTATNRTLAEMGRSPVKEEQVRSWIGDGVRALVRRGLEATGHCDDALLELAHEQFLIHYGHCFADATRPYPGVLEVLSQFHRAGLPMAVITNKAAAFTEPLLEATGIRSYLDGVVSGDQVARKKPAPEPVHRALEELGVTAADAVLVGDSANDIAAGLGAGCSVICVAYGYNRGEDMYCLGAQQVVSTFHQLADCLVLSEDLGG